MEKMSDKLLVLDLDETLIHATKNRLEISEDFQLDEYFIHKRPYLNEFLSNISNHFKIGIWSSASDNYVNEIVKQIKPALVEFEIIWGRSKCSAKKDHIFDTVNYEKRLDKLKKKGFKLEQIIIVDDSPEKLRTNYGNAVYIKEYKGDKSDEELKYLHDFLISLKNVENIRAIEKRGWRSNEEGASTP